MEDFNDLPPSYSESTPLISAPRPQLLQRIPQHQDQTIYIVETQTPIAFSMDGDFVIVPYHGSVRMVCPYENGVRIFLIQSLCGN
jgi:hypothetical protein